MKFNLLTVAALLAGALACGSCGKTGGTPAEVDSLVANMVPVEGGTFKMGATPEQKTGVGDDERPVHDVTLSPYRIGRYEVTQAQWQAVMGENPSMPKNPDAPVCNVSWDDCQQFLKKLNEMTGRKFRLPTEAEWEYAARGGSLSKGTQYAGEGDNYKRVAWCIDNMKDEAAQPVGRKEPNELGLYDMSGNIMEWCADWYGSYTDKPQTDPKGPAQGSARVARGGAWNFGADMQRTSFRYNEDPAKATGNVGLRIAE